MATTIDELVVTLGLDPTQFNQGQREALERFKQTRESAKKTASDMEADGKQAARFYGQIKDQALSLIAVLVGAKDIAGFIGKTVTDLSAVGRIAVVMGQATPDVLAVGMAVQRIGGNAQAAQQQMLGLSQTLQGWKLGQRPGQQFLQAFGFIGGNISDNPLQILEKFAAFAERTKNKQLVENVGTSLGLNQDLINLTIGGKGQFDQAIAQSYKNGIPTEADIKKVQDLQQAFGDLAQSLKFAGTELVVDVADPLTGLLNTVTGLIHQFPELTKLILATVAALITLKGLGFGAGVIRGLTGGAAVAETAGGVGLVGTVAGVAAIGATGAALTGAVGTPMTAGAFSRVIANPEAASDADLRAAIAFAQTNLANAPQQYKAQAAAALESVAQAGLRRWGAARSAAGTAPVAGSGGPARGGRGLSAAGKEALAYLTAHGIDPQVALGVGAGITAEGGAFGARDQFDKAGNYAFGIEQLRGGRRAALFAKYGKNPTKDQELAFLLTELQGGDKGGPQVLAAHNAMEAMMRYVLAFMRPGAGAAGDIRRGSAAIAGSTNITVNVTTTSQDGRRVGQQVGREVAHIIASTPNNGPV